MKDFERLKKICEREGLHFDFDHISQTAVVAKLKDPWKGIEFAESLINGFIIKMPIHKSRIHLFKPSTEFAYIEQLKKEAFERFGLIKFGDKFQRDFDAIRDKRKIFCIGDQGYIGDGFSYNKENDALMYDGHFIYKKDKWAKKIEKINVQFKTSGGFSKEDNTIWEYKFEFIIRNKPKENLNEYGDFLAQQLEEHLNNKQNEAEDELNQKS
jgi:exonuclease I